MKLKSQKIMSTSFKVTNNMFILSYLPIMSQDHARPSSVRMKHNSKNSNVIQSRFGHALGKKNIILNLSECKTTNYKDY